MTKFDWIMLSFGLSGWLVARLSATFYTKLLIVLSQEVVEILRSQQADAQEDK